MNVSLTKELEQYIREKVSSGRYTSASEVVREALRLLIEHDHLRELRAEELQRAISGNPHEEAMEAQARLLGIPTASGKKKKKKKKGET